MKYLKFISSILFIFLWLISTQAQDRSTLFLGGHLYTLDGDTNNNEYLKSSAGFNLGFFTPIWSAEAYNLGVNVSGLYSGVNSDFGNLEDFFRISREVETTSNTISNKLKQSLIEFGVGPQFNYKLGQKFWISPILQGGYFNFDQDELVLTQEVTFQAAGPPQTFEKEVFRQNDVSESGFFLKPALRLSYQIAQNWSIWGEASYFIADINTTQNRLVPFDEPNEAGEYFPGQIIESQEFSTTENETSLNNLGMSLGLAYSFGTSSTKAQDYNAARSNKPSSIARDIKDDDEAESTQTKAQDYNSSRSNKPRSVAFTNPLEERKEKEKSKCKLVNVSPPNNTNFVEANQIKNLKWKVFGDKIQNPQFIIEVTKVNSNQQPLRTYVAKTSKTSISAQEVFKGAEITDGHYRWNVKQVSDGNGNLICGESNHLSFYVNNCEIDFSITNEEIECLGYEGENRKYKICFDSNYSSPSGDLTFTEASSDLTVFDQSYSALSYTLVNPTNLQTQQGAPPNTVSYCIEVTVPPSVTEIGFGLQGDDLDPSPVTCQPGVSFNFDELPDCICNDCEDIDLSFDNYTISMNGNTGNQFDFNGDINVNVPIYGIEFQVQSINYTANPSACTNGVSSIEESGMFLMPGTTVNGSTSLQLANETVSGSSATNNNATKNIKYISNTALTGAIPVNLTVGLPGPLPGFDPDCCEMDYTLCIKIKVIYDETSCKSCTFTHCFTFNNQ